MDIITAVLQASVNTILIFAGIFIVFFTLFNVSLSKKSIELRTISKSNSRIVIIAIVFGAGLILVGLFFKPEASSQTPPTTTTPAFSVSISSRTPTFVPATPTQTPTVVASSTQIPNVATTQPAPTFTPQPPTIGLGWKNGCISSLWIPFPSSVLTTPKDGCLSRPVGLFDINNGNLKFQYQGDTSSAEIQGLFARLPLAGTANLDVLLTNLTNGEIWMGIFSKPDINSSGILLVIPGGEITNRVIVEKAMPEEKRIDATRLILSDKAVYQVTFDVSRQNVKPNSVDASYNFDDFPLDSEEKWLFIGFKAVNGYNRIEAEFSNLVIQDR